MERSERNRWKWKELEEVDEGERECAREEQVRGAKCKVGSEKSNKVERKSK